MFQVHFITLVRAMKSIAGLFATAVLLASGPPAQAADIGNPYVTGFDGWVSTDTEPALTANPNWGVLLAPNPIPGPGFGQRFLFESSNGFIADGTTTAGVADGKYKPFLLVNTAVTTPAAYTLDSEMATVDDEGLGIVFGYEDNDNYFRVGFRPVGNTDGYPLGTSVQKVVGGVITNIADSASFTPLFDGTPFDARVVVNGGDWEVLVDSGSGYASVLNSANFGGTDPDLQAGHYGVHSWSQASQLTAAPLYGSIFGNISVTSGTLNKTTNFVDALSAVPWRRLDMYDQASAMVIDSGSDIGNFAQDFLHGTIRDDSNGFANATAGAPNTDFIGPAVVVDGAGPAALTDYRFTTRVENKDNDGIGLLFRVQDNENFYRINWSTEGQGTGTTRPFLGMSVQKHTGSGGVGIWEAVAVDADATPNYDDRFLPGDSVPFDVSVEVIGGEIRISVLSDPGGPNEEVHTYAPIVGIGIPNGSVGFTNWGNGGPDNGAVYSSFRGETDMNLVTEIGSFTDLSLSVDRADGVATLTNNSGSPVDIESVDIRTHDGNLVGSTWLPVSGPLAASGTVNLGDIWVESRLEELILEVDLVDGGKYFFEADFTGGPDNAPYARSDLDTDGDIDPDDWGDFFPNMLTDLSAMTNVQQVLAGDLDLDGDNDVNDFALFKQDYEMENGSGSFNQMIAGVPEPSTYALLFVAIVGFGAIQLRRSKTGLLVICGLAVAGVFSFAATDARADVLAAQVEVIGTGAGQVVTVLHQTPVPELFVATSPTGNTADLSLLEGFSTVGTGGTPLSQTNGVIIASPNQFQYDSVGNRNFVSTPGELTTAGTAGVSFPNGMWLSTTAVSGGGVERNFNFAMAYFRYADGWTAGHVRGDDGAFFSGGTNVTVTKVLDNPPTPVVFGTGHYKLSVAGVDSRTDGMLFAINDENDTSGNVVPVGVLPDGSGWDVRVNDQGFGFPTTEQADWGFVYVPYGGTANLRAAGEVALSGNSVSVNNRTGAFGVRRVDIGDSGINGSIIPPAGFLGSQGSDGTIDTGRFLVSIPGKDDTTGYLMVGVAGYITENGVSGADDNFLTWEYNDELGGFLVESYDLAGAVLEDSNTYFAYFDYAEPIELGTPELYALTAEVNRADGTITIKNPTDGTIAFDYYQFDSAAGSLNADDVNWDSLNDKNFESTGGGIGQSFDEAGGSNSFSLAEVTLQSDLDIPQLVADDDVSIGAAYNHFMNAEDLVFRYRDQGVVVTGYVNYFGVAPPQGVPGDYNDDGVVNAADYVVWRDHLNQVNANLPNDATGAIVDGTDYTVWRGNFGAEEGSGSGSQANVPEPSSLILLAGLALLFSAGRFGRRFV